MIHLVVLILSVQNLRNHLVSKAKGIDHRLIHPKIW